MILEFEKRNIINNICSPNDDMFYRNGVFNKYIIYYDIIYIYSIIKYSAIPNTFKSDKYKVIFSYKDILSDVLIDHTDIWIDKYDNIYKISDISYIYLDKILIFLEKSDTLICYKKRKPYILNEIRRIKFFL